MGKWNERHGIVLSALIEEFNESGIRYFIFRNYQGLPNMNSNKDVDIIVDPIRKNDANRIINEVYKSCGFTHVYMVRWFTSGYSWFAMDVTQHLSIHIDLIYGYRVKGAEIFTFDELFTQTIDYKSFNVLNDYYESMMVFISKQFGYKKPTLKIEYQSIISDLLNNHPSFVIDLQKMVGKRIADEEISRIRRQDFDGVLKISGALAKSLKSFCFRKNAIGTLLRAMQFYLLTFNRLILQRRKYIKSFSVMAPDGAGKTTFLDALIEEIGFYFTKDSSLCDIYHFRPQLFPNLGAVGGKTGMMKPDTNYNEPHRAKPAGRLSSLLRLSYYWLDYVVGWYSKTLKDIQYDKFTVFDRYAYDLIVDPHRTRLNLPRWVRMLYVKLMPEPRVSFYIDVEPGEIYRRKQELQPEEIVRQVKEYRRLAKSNKRIITIDGNRSVDEMVKDAIQVILDNFANRCD